MHVGQNCLNLEKRPPFLQLSSKLSEFFLVKDLTNRLLFHLIVSFWESILNLFPLTSTNIFLCAKVFGQGKKRVQFSQLLPVTAKNSIHVSKSKTLLLIQHKPDTHLSNYSHLSNKRDVTLIDFEKFHLTQIKNPPYTFIDFLDFSTLHSTFIRFMY